VGASINRRQIAIAVNSILKDNHTGSATKPPPRSVYSTQDAVS
jgi:hypothetical protein